MNKTISINTKGVETEIKNDNLKVTVKKRYRQPSLLIYGTVRGLTATGTGSMMENEENLVMTRRP